MAGGRFSVWSLVNGAQHSPSRVKSGPGAACYASRWDVAPGGPDRARSCHWPPLTPPRTTHCSTCPPCRLVPRVTSYPRRGSDVETVEHFSRGSRWYRSRRCSRSQDSRIARWSISITISTTIPSDVRLFFFFFYFVRFFFQFFEHPFGVGETFFWVETLLFDVDSNGLIGFIDERVVEKKCWIRWQHLYTRDTQNFSSSFASLFDVTIVI